MDADLAPMRCGSCGSEFGPDDTHCPECGVARAEAETPENDAPEDEVTEASMESFPASDPPSY